MRIQILMKFQDVKTKDLNKRKKVGNTIKCVDNTRVQNQNRCIDFFKFKSKSKSMEKKFKNI